MAFDLPLVIGHRGARAVKTENTLEAFDYACRSGVKWVELDAMLSADGQVMVFHDETLDRMCLNATGRLDSFTAEELRSFKMPNGTRIPFLAEVLDLLNAYGANVNIEIKPSKPELARETARRVWETVPEKGFDDPDRLLFSSFEWAALEETLVLAPHIRRGVLVEDVSPDWRPAAKKVEAFSINYDADLLTPELAREILGGGYRLPAYTVNDADRVRELMSWGVEAFFCDSPAEMIAELRANGVGR